MDIRVVETVTKTIGSLALAYPDLQQLGVADIMDAITTNGKERDVSTGTVVEVLVLNPLSVKPIPISKIHAWAREQVIEEIWGVSAAAINLQFKELAQPGRFYCSATRGYPSRRPVIVMLETK